MTWATWKKKNKSLPIYQRTDLTKGWVRTTVDPTLRHYGYLRSTENDIQFDERSPRQILNEDFKNIIEKADEVVYHVVIPTASYAGYYKYLDVYWKPSVG